MKKLTIILLLTSFVLACKDKNRVVEPQDGPAKLVMLETEYNFGELSNNNEVVEHEFHFVNKGSKKLVISKVRPLCHCTVVDYPKEPVKPGHEGVFKVYLDVNELSPGFFTRTIEIYSNGDTERATLFIRGNKQ